MSNAESNGFKNIVQHVDAFEAVDAELEAMKMAYMNQCREKREAQKRIVKMVKAEGFATDSFRAVIKRRRLQKKIDAIEEDLEDEDAVESYEMMIEALGGLADLPLGQAAAAEAKSKPTKPRKDRKASDTAAIDSLSDDDDDAFDDADPAKQQVVDNVTKLNTGIKPLPN